MKKFEKEKEMLKERIKMTGNSKRLFRDLIEEDEQDSEEQDDEDFYKNYSSGEENSNQKDDSVVESYES